MPFDVVIHGDFSSPATAFRAEVQTLFFLASWLEHAGRQARETCPLHLASVGADGPPESVATLARRAGARITVHEPLLLALSAGGKREFNRLRALDAGPFSTGRVLVLDAGTLVVRDPRPALDVLPENTLASSPADRALLPDDAWPALYHALRLAPPTARMRALRAELELPPRDGPPAFPAQATQSAAMLPCFDPGVLLLPTAVATGALREIWPAHLAVIAGELASAPVPATGERARPGLMARLALATAHQALLTGGQVTGGWRRLPRGCDARVVHLQSGALGFGQVKLFRAGDFLAKLTEPSQIQGVLRATAGQWRSLIVEGCQRNVGADRWADPGVLPRWRRWRAARAGRRPEPWLRDLYQRHVRPSLRAAGEYV